MRNLLLTLLALLLIAPLTSRSQDMLQQKPPIDPAMRIGKLDNGMTYYIRHNEEPKERVSFYIIQNVGALLEEDNQDGLAHFLEHMAFNGTKHYEGKGIINYLEKNGVAFGRNINAYTAFNETVYNLSDVPATNPGLIDSCLLVLHDWSNYLLLTEDEIDLERGVISEEWRTRRDASWRLREKYFPVLTKGSKFAERDIIGDLDIIKNFDPETLRKFYHDWYRTDLQAIAIVGDIDVDEIEAKVRERFSTIPAVEDAKERPFFDIPEHEETRFVLATDEEATSSIIRLYIKHKAPEQEDKNLGYLRDGYIGRLFTTMANERITELLQKGDPPFINGYIGKMGFLRGYESLGINITANPNQEDTGFRAIYTEAQRIVKHGFTASELDRAKTNLLTSMESAYKQRDKISNDHYVEGVKAHFLMGEPLTDAEFDWQFGQAILQTISVEEINAKAREWIVPENRVVIITGPAQDAKHLTESEALAILEEVENSEIDPYEDTVEAASLIEEDLAGATVISSKRLEDLDAVEWKLSNNATVIYKHADFEKDNVALKAYSPGGTSLFSTDDLATSMMLGDFVGSFGVGEFDAIALRKVLTGKKAGVSVGFEGLNESFSGSSTPKDFETMMQLLYLYFEHPRFDQEAYEALRSRYISYLANMANDPNKIMSDSLSLIISNYHERTKLMSAELFDEITFEKMEELYRDRIMDAGEFTFFIVGNIDGEVAKEMAKKYIGSLTDDEREESWIDHKVRAPKGKTVKEIEVPLQTEKANVTVYYRKEMEYSPETNLKLNVLRGVLDLRYTEEIREKEGGTYGVGVGAASSKYPYERKALQMRFDTDPEKAEHLKSLVYKEIDKIVENGPTAEDVEKVVLNLKKNRQQSKEHNGYWMNTLYNYYYLGFNGDAPENFDNILDNLTTEDMQQFAIKFFDGADIIDVVFKPQQ